MYIDNITSDGIALSNNGKEMLIKVYEQEIKRLKEEYIMLQNASDEVEEEKDKEIERLNNITKKVIVDIEDVRDKNNYYEDYAVDSSVLTYWIEELKGSDKE